MEKCCHSRLKCIQPNDFLTSTSRLLRFQSRTSYPIFKCTFGLKQSRRQEKYCSAMAVSVWKWAQHMFVQLENFKIAK